MSLDGQRLQAERYSIIPRTLIFLQDGDQVLLMRISSSRGAWAGKLNGIGGHIEQGEEVIQAARREIQEETGLAARDLQLCGVVLIDSQTNPGIGLYVLVGRASATEPLQPSDEGQALWIPQADLQAQELVEDLPLIMPRALRAYADGTTFSALYTYDHDDSLHIEFGQ